MDKNNFFEQVTKTLEGMSVEQKEQWILDRAKLVSEDEQQSFLMSLTGEKKIIYMPTEQEIFEFCERVNNGDIYVEYETHYYEFDSEGRYMDDWGVHYNDPKQAFLFLDRVFSGCYDLLQLGEYVLAANILDNVCRLEFREEDAEETEDSGNGDPFTIVDAVDYRLLNVDKRRIAHDWISALLLARENEVDIEFAEKLVEILHFELCRKFQLGNFAELLSDTLLDMIEQVLEEEVNEIDEELASLSCGGRDWFEKITLDKKKARNRHLFLEIQKMCNRQECVSTRG